MKPQKTKRIVAPQFWPHLGVEATAELPETQIGYLHMHKSLKKIEVGSVEGREFRLLQCLFSPLNFPTAKHSPVTQTYERVFSYIGLKEDLSNKRLLTPESAEREKQTIIESSMRKLQRGEAGAHLSFIFGESRLRMEVVG